MNSTYPNKGYSNVNIPKKSFMQIVAKKIKLFVITVIIVMLSNILIELGPSYQRTDNSRQDTELDSQNRDTIPKKNTIYRECRKNETSHSKEKGKATLAGMRYPPKGPFFENYEINVVSFLAVVVAQIKRYRRISSIVTKISYHTICYTTLLAPTNML